METLFNILLVLHIAGGTAALAAGYGAMVVKRGSNRHRWLGKVYVAGMSFVVLSGAPMAVIHPNLFLFGIVILTAYLVFQGFARAKNRKGNASPTERMVAVVMLMAAIASLVAIGWVVATGYAYPRTFLITGAVFAAIGLALSIVDLRAFRRGPIVGQDRLVDHLIKMCAGLIATTTAVAVTLVGYVPAVPPIMAWLGPTIIISPLIFMWARQVKAGTFRF